MVNKNGGDDENAGITEGQGPTSEQKFACLTGATHIVQLSGNQNGEGRKGRECVRQKFGDAQAEENNDR